MRGDFSNGAAKEKWVFQRPGRARKKKKTNNAAGQFGKTKQRRSFQTCGKKFNDESYLIENKCKCANEVYLLVFITGL